MRSNDLLNTVYEETALAAVLRITLMNDEHGSFIDRLSLKEMMERKGRR